MSLIIFLIILSALVIVHELGHFLVARFFGIRVDEFGLGFPPRIKTLFSWRNTPFTINWLPFGGFVRIFGENPSEQPQEVTPMEDSFQNKNRGIQAAVLVAGVVGNFLFAWFLFSIGFMTGLPAPANLSLPIVNPHTVITMVLPDSPAATLGLKSGDTIISVSRGPATLVGKDGQELILPEDISNFIARSLEPIDFKIMRGEEIYTKTVTPQEGIVEDRPAVGISMDIVGMVKLPIHESIWQGLKITSRLTVLTAEAIGVFITEAVAGKADLSSITGPVGIVGMVGDVRELGFPYLLTFTALISINLLIINLLPFPALDGGRLFFTGVEAATRRRVSPKVFNIVNAVGFALLVFLMLLVTVQDIKNIL